MLLKHRLAAHGATLFRWRSLWPLLLIPLALGALTQSGVFEKLFGERVEEAWDVFCVLVAFTGLGIRVATVGFVPAGTSGRNTRSQRAAVLNTSGLYSVVRNPLYLGNTVILLGFALATKVWWFPVLTMAFALLYYERIIFAEEAYLQAKFGAAYRGWAAATPALVPKWGKWRRPDLPFSVRTALRREYTGFYVIVVTMTLIEAVGDVLGEGMTVMEWVRNDPQWPVFLGLGTAAYLSVRLVKKRTSWLAVPGR